MWYLPHHGVYNHKKPEKVRVVFDCSATYAGLSLNDCLLPGPDLTNSLVGVLSRFREHQVAFMADIESMFFQVRVPATHYDYLRFLWWPGGNLDGELKEYHMKVHLFGAISSPSICNFALRQIAIDHEAELDNTQYTLKSMPTVQSTCELVHHLSAACSSGGFRLTKFASNSVSVLNSIPKEDHSKELRCRDIDYDKLPIEHALCIQWSVENDTFNFSVMLPNKPLTRRGVLSTVSALYDPLGLVAPFILPAKKILQDLCKETSLDWDDVISEVYQNRFLKWLNDIPKLQHVSLKRCFKPETCKKVTSSQIHIFADASTIGYGAVAYLCQSDGEAIYSSFLIGKARLAPSKATTIPRLELTAATVAVHLGHMMQKELDIPILNTYYHTDSTTVLYYISSEHRRFPVFVTNRVQQIRDCTDPQQWRYVDTSILPQKSHITTLVIRDVHQQLGGIM